MGLLKLQENTLTLSDEIEGSETLYRAIPSKPNFWDAEENCPTSAVYKDKRGLSVDRCGQRTDKDLIEVWAERRPNYGLLRLPAQECMNSGVQLLVTPEDDNPYHAEIHGADKPLLKKREIRALQECAILVNPPTFTKTESSEEVTS